MNNDVDEGAGCQLVMLKHVRYLTRFILRCDVRSNMDVILAYLFHICNQALLSSKEKCRRICLIMVLCTRQLMLFLILWTVKLTTTAGYHEVESQAGRCRKNVRILD